MEPTDNVLEKSVSASGMYQNQPEKMSEDELLRVLIHDFSRGYDLLVRIYYYLLQTVIKGRAVDQFEVDDILQEVFIRVFVALEGYTDERKLSLKLRSWLITIARNTTTNANRALFARAKHVGAMKDGDWLEMVGDQRGDPWVYLQRKETFQKLTEYVNQLSEKHAIIFHCYYEKDWSCRQIADYLAIPVGSVTAFLARSRRFLYEKNHC
ncbi:MAG TPA: RNA polymerase sigma factor [Ktedonobacteraceae bacterium]